MSKVKSNKQSQENGNKSFNNRDKSIADVEKVNNEILVKSEEEIKEIAESDEAKEFIDNAEAVTTAEPVETHEAEMVIEVKPEPGSKKDEVKVNIITLENKLPKAEPGKDFAKVEIVDISAKKVSKKSLKYTRSIEPVLDKTLDSLILAGGGIIALTVITSKTLANIGTSLLKK